MDIDSVTQRRRHYEQLHLRARAAQRDLAAVAATATSRDGAVTVTVNPAGALVRLTLGERAGGLSRVQLAEAVVTTARRAQADAAQRAQDILTPLLGADSAALRFVQEQFPATPPDGGWPR